MDLQADQQAISTMPNLRSRDTFNSCDTQDADTGGFRRSSITSCSTDNTEAAALLDSKNEHVCDSTQVWSMDTSSDDINSNWPLYEHPGVSIQDQDSQVSTHEIVSATPQSHHYTHGSQQDEQGLQDVHCQDFAADLIDNAMSADAREADLQPAETVPGSALHSGSAVGTDVLESSSKTSDMPSAQVNEAPLMPSTKNTVSFADTSTHEQADGQDLSTSERPTQQKLPASVLAETPQNLNPVDVLSDIISALYVAATNEKGSGLDDGGSVLDTSGEQDGGPSVRSREHWEQQDPIGTLTQMATVTAAAAGILTGGVAQSLLDMVASPKTSTKAIARQRTQACPEGTGEYATVNAALVHTGSHHAGSC